MGNIVGCRNWIFSNALIRCAAILGLSLIRLNVFLAALVGSITNWVGMIFLRRWRTKKINHTAPVNAEDRREMIRLSLSQLPNAIFYCFQGQVTILILSWWGNTVGIANIMALGRIAMLFNVFFCNIQ